MEKSEDIKIFSHVGYPTMVLTTTTRAKRCSKDSNTTIRHSANARREGNGTAPNQEYLGHPLKHKEFQNELQT